MGSDVCENLKKKHQAKILNKARCHQKVLTRQPKKPSKLQRKDLEQNEANPDPVNTPPDEARHDTETTSTTHSSCFSCRHESLATTWEDEGEDDLGNPTNNVASSPTAEVEPVSTKPTKEEREEKGHQFALCLVGTGFILVVYPLEVTHTLLPSTRSVRHTSPHPTPYTSTHILVISCIVSSKRVHYSLILTLSSTIDRTCCYQG